MSTRPTITCQSHWISPKDSHNLKRRHTRGNSSYSRSSRTTFSSSLSSNISLSDSTYIHRDHHPYQDEELCCTDSLCTKNNIRYGGYNNNINDLEKPMQSSDVPSWFGSLRSFAISASATSRGVFTSLNASLPSHSSKSNPSSSPCRGKSSSIYYAGLLDDDSDSGSSNNYDEPITSKNGLKENRVRGPRMNWAKLDPSLGSIFSQPYKAIPEPELSSPSSPSTASASSLQSPTFSDVEHLAVSEACRHDDDASIYHAEIDRVTSNGDDECPKFSSYRHYGRMLKEDADLGNGPTSNAYANAYLGSKSTPTTSAFSYIKSYVPSLPGFNNETKRTGARSPTTVSSSLSSSSGTGLWSIRKLSMTLLSNDLYAPIDPSSDEAFIPTDNRKMHGQQP
ncbi:hypothetical protein BX616_009013 [Lobosporangium transversale]|uniref:Uncharacterized protein n=1 Tax=Lobosporangium transversale TaxID=64571 RepID=A0A1Y2GXL6_9FUNG|nr:hypothetical protein BCR41DRAFT_349674 [Lobosporangium transversale]KAF9914079.1 hypothetical protein BX616_009013 [Lobosporangium transversale]ORZ22783.1 hypothetical protein BCR41DRAFT_349674 [Lobosporangium transversale]|eukprot:XP_021883337.1 hypothetical protein BCR41DRAFT_349674 [Lobosporangium transversale]